MLTRLCMAWIDRLRTRTLRDQKLWKNFIAVPRVEVKPHVLRQRFSDSTCRAGHELSIYRPY